jgi:hypothetical protein
MLRYNFYDISRIQLSHTELSAICCDAWARATDPSASIDCCPYRCNVSREMRLKRVVWRSVFRRRQETYFEYGRAHAASALKVAA